jgi:transposase
MRWNNICTKTVSFEYCYQVLRDLSRFYKEISRMHMNLHNTIQLTFPEVELVLSNRLTFYGLVIIAQYPHPSLESFQNHYKELATTINHKKISENRARNKAEKLIAYS